MDQQARTAVEGWRRTVDTAYGQQQGAVSPTQEYDDIQRFIYDEMVRNSGPGTVHTLQALNDNASGLAPGKTSAYELWAFMVRPDGEWDHKQRILNRTNGETFSLMPGDSGTDIRYDAWSNIHYGYVGIEAGFTPEELSTGADVADLLGQGRTDPGDEVAVQIGIELRQQYPPDQLTPEHINEAIERHRAELEQTGMIRPDVHH